ncbi:hypothetical protein BH11PLA2_BH11PLA2_43940 [soil metagenome]
MIRTSWLSPAPSPPSSSASWWLTARCAVAIPKAAPIPAIATKRRLKGCCTRFGVAFTPITGMQDGSVVTDRQYQLLAGSLNESLAAIAAGRHRVTLRFAHDLHQSAELCSTADGTLKVYIRGDELRFRVSDTTRAGRRAIRAVRGLSHYREASVGLDNINSLLRPNADGTKTTMVLKATLSEISLVERGAVPGSRVFVT